MDVDSNVVILNDDNHREIMDKCWEWFDSPADWRVLHLEAQHFINKGNVDGGIECRPVSRGSPFEDGPSWVGMAETTMGNRIKMTRPMSSARGLSGCYFILDTELEQAIDGFIGKQERFGQA